MSAMSDIYTEFEEAVKAWELNGNREPLNAFLAEYPSLYSPDVYDEILERVLEAETKIIRIARATL